MAADIGMDATTSLDEAYAAGARAARRRREGDRPAVRALPAAAERDPDDAGAACTRRPVPTPDDIRGSTTIVEILKLFPNGEAARLMSRLAWPCAHCGGAFHEPLTLAAKRHANDPRAVLTAFRALAGGWTDARADRVARSEGRRVTVAASTWVGRALPRLEDEALLRGQGRFIDDSSPCRTRGTRRSCARRSRTRASGRSMSRAGARAAGRRRRTDGRRRRRAVAARFRRASREACRTTRLPPTSARYVGEPVAVVVARVALPRRGRCRARRGRLRPARPARSATVHERSFSYGAVDEAFEAADVVVEGRYAFPRWSVHAGRVLRRGRRLARRRRSRRGRTSRGRSRCTPSRPPRSGCRGSKLRLITPPDSGGSFGIKSSVFAYVVLMGLASRKLGVPVRWTEDRLEHLAASAHATGRMTELDAAFAADGELLGLRYDVDRGRRRVRPCAGAGDALPHARLALRRVPRPQRRGAEPRRAHEPLPDGPQPRLRRPAALLRARADDGHRGGAGSDSIRPSCGGATSCREFPYTTRERRHLRLGRLRGRLDDALELVRYDERRAEQAAGAATRDRHRLRRRAVDLEHGLHHACADARPSAPRPCRSRATSRAASSPISPLGGISVRHLDDAAGPGTPHGRRADRRRPPRCRAARTST